MWMKSGIQWGVGRRLSTFAIKECDLHRLDKGPPSSATLTKDEALKYYREMQSIRRLETNIGNMYKSKAVRGFCHLYNGQEAIAVGMFNSIRPQDTLVASYRVHGWVYLLSNFNACSVMAELIARSTGVSKGKGGSMHMFTNRFFGGNGIVGAQVPIGTGLGFTAKYTGNKGVAFSLYGDGAADQGQVFEAFNIAKLWVLPCVFVCENNHYSMGTSETRHSADVDFYKRGDYVPGIRVDGMDVLAVREATKFAIEYCTSGKGPLVMEVQTYRYHGHSMSDPGTSYRTREEVDKVRASEDPIKTFTRKIVESKLVEPEELKKIESQIKTYMDEEMKKAKSAMELPVADLTADIYKKPLDSDVRGLNSFTWHKHLSRPPPK